MEFDLPRPPNFIRLAHGGTVDVGDLSPEEAKRISELLAEQFIEHAETRRRSYV